MLDETIITETPPLYSCYCRIGEQACVPISGNRSKRILHGSLNIYTGDTLLWITTEWNDETHQWFLSMIRSHWRGWNIVLFEDRGSPHISEESFDFAYELGIEIRLLPKATPELNAMDQLWRRVKGPILASRPTRSVEESALDVCNYIYGLTPAQRLRKAGVLSGNFWLTK